MACEFEVIVSGDSRDYLEQVASLALDEISALDRKLSCFDPTSEVSYLNSEARRRPVIVSPELFEVLSLARRVWRETGGAFDVTAGPLIALWREAERTGVEPDPSALCEALGRVGMHHVHLDNSVHSVHFGTDLSISLGAIGKGFAVARAAETLREYAISSALVSAGGSTIYGLGDKPGESGWRIGIRHPSDPDQRVAEVVLRDQALSTSGGPIQRDAAVEETFEHIIDPRTGAPAPGGLISASAVSPDAALADALSTAFYLLGRNFAEAYCPTHEGVSAVLVEAGDEGDLAVHNVA